MPSSRRAQWGRILLTMTTLLLFSVSSTCLLNEPVQAAFLGLNTRIAFANNQYSGNCTCQYNTTATLTTFMTAYDTTTLTQTAYLTSTTLVPTATTVTKTSSITVTKTALTNVTNTQTVTSTSHTTMSTTKTSTTYTNVPSTLTELTTLTSQVTQTITSSGGWLIAAEVGTALLILAALAALLVHRIRARPSASKVCPQCGYSNPPYAHSFCIKCGNPLEASRT